MQLWEKHEALPVHRHIHRKQGSVYAFRKELETWRTGATQVPGRPAHAAAEMEASPGARTGDADNPVTSGFRLGIAAFECMDDNPDSRRLLRGLQQELIAELCGRSVETHLITESQVDQEGDLSLFDLRSRVETLHLGGYLTGNVSRDERRLRVNVQLFSSETLHCAWSRRFESSRESLSDALCDVAQCLVAALPLDSLKRNSPRFPAQANTGDSAEQAYHLGRHFWKQRNGPVLRSAEECFHESIRLNPRFPDAYAGLADCYVSMAYSQMIPCSRAYQLANQALTSLRRLATRIPTTHSSQANVYLSCNFDFDGAERECALACERDAGNSRGLQLYSVLAGARGQHQRSIDYALSALRLDPLSKVLNNEVGYALFFAGEYDRASYYIGRALETDPMFIMGHVLSGMVDVERRAWDTALTSFRIVCKTMDHPTYGAALLAHLHAAMGDAAEARKLISRVNATMDGSTFPYLPIAAAHAQLGERSEALWHLERAKQERDTHITHVANDPRFFSLHSTSEFRTLTASIRCA